jgi:hypothetical protein
MYQEDVENYIIRICLNFTPTKYYGNKIKVDEMDRSCDMYQGEEKCIKDFGGET